MTERDAQRELQILQDRYRAIVDSSPVGIVVHAEGAVRFANPAAARIMLAESEKDLLGLRIMEFIHPESLGEVERRVSELYRAGQQGELMEQRWIRLDGSVLWVEVVASSTTWDGAPASQVVFADISKRKQALEEKAELEERLRHALRLESVGRLAGGVAHDFNNMLTAVKGYLRLVSRALPDEHRVQADLQEIDRVADRAADLTRQLLAFSRRQTIDPRVLVVSHTVDEMRRLLERVLGEDISIAIARSREPWRVKVDPGQLEQVLMNLAVNARDAMPNGGQLFIETANAEIEASEPSTRGARSGDYVRLSVTDEGVGMDAVTVGKIFEPFFSTKETGTGLGLSTVYGIVEQNGGFIEVRSLPGQGTTFDVYLPRTVEDTPVEHAVVRAAAPPPSATILVAEDEPAVRNLTALILAEEGYSVHTADDGRAALAFADAFQGTIDLLLTDVVMPGLDGRELYEQLRECRPDMAVLFMSGYPNDIVAHHGILEENTQFMHKPFDVDTLCERVRGVLDAHFARTEG